MTRFRERTHMRRTWKWGTMAMAVTAAAACGDAQADNGGENALE
jgi:hypothetical protein